MSPTTTPDPVAAVANLTPTIRAECIDVDKTRVLPDSVVKALQDEGVFRLLAPREVGGAEVDPVVFLELVEAASYADGSVGWCVMIGGCYATFAGMLPHETANAIYGDPSTISAGAFRPTGTAEVVDGGYRVSGRWPLASGSTHANWYVAGCVVTRDGEPDIGPNGMPIVRETFLPAADIEVLDTWESTGLRGTASHDYTISNAFVAKAYTTWFQEPPTCDRALYRMPPIAMFATFIGAVPLGIARHAIEAFVELADTKTSALSPSALADKPVAQAQLGRAQALVAASRTHLIASLNDLWIGVSNGHRPTMADRGRLWLAATFAAHSAVEAIEHLYTAAGADSIYATCPLDRCLRDARTAVQHVTTQQQNFELAGRQLLGRPVIPSPWMIDYRGEG